MRIALIQTGSPTGEDAAARRARVGRTLADLPTGIDLIVLPELWAVGFHHFDDYTAEAEDLTGPTVRLCADAARARQAWVLAGSIVERADGGRLRNTAVLLDPEGRVATTSSKIHIFGYASREVELLSPGDTVSSAPTPFGRLGTTTCYDLRFPGLWNELVDAGAELVAVPAAWPAARLEHWRLLTTARALDTQTFVIAVNSCGTQNGVALGGHSRVVDPWGEVVAEAGADEEVLIVDIDPARVGRTRTEFPVLADRLTDYRPLRRTEVTA
ncbi:carbon-nitrogen family hydrolase [Pseudonocardia sp. C8]|uniref:nitrilase-related carbon-nitrogen hydrolase n=1 Tax=Pseudonocardia sp. C8 TaxID=2762759 RepID=UPI001642F0FE|nr:nitrilase-related carbon-nitrogen hydrolase [Pseudonocardia sp. C8]MBC3190368.1 carbon-nitrogen family hydrolase [Pseudonocardia sp. C8]